MKKNLEPRKYALIGVTAKTRRPEMDVSLHGVQSVTQVLMGELDYLCIYENFP